MRNYLPEVELLAGVSATGHSIANNVKDFTEKIITVAVAGITGGNTVTFKVKGSCQDDVDFTAAKSPTNRWDYIAIVDKESGSSIDGNDGVQVLADDVMAYVLNDDGTRFVCVEISEITSGDIDVYAYLASSNEN